MKSTLLAVCVVLAIASSGCLSAQNSTGVGAVGGAGIGAGIGAIFGNPALGALIGVGIGTIGGALAQSHIEKKKKREEAKELEEQLMEGQEKKVTSKDGSGLKVTDKDKTFVEGHNEYVLKKEWIDTSKKERVWIEEKTEGDRRIDGHYEDRLIPSGYWDVQEEKVWIPDHYE